MDLKCNSCGAALIVAEHLRTADCPYCGSSSVIERPATAGLRPPTFALGFGLSLTQARERVAGWLAGRSAFARAGFKKSALEGIRGVYVPAYLYSAQAEASYSARVGETYTETQTYTTVRNGKTETRTRRVTKTEWHTLTGRFAEYLSDLVVTASRGVDNAELERIEPFELKALRRYEPALVSGWIAEEPTLTADESLDLARAEANEAVGARLDALMPGDSHCDLHHETQLTNEAIEPCLVPVWVMAARYHPEKPPVRILVNGQTGQVWGKVPLSWVKIVAASLSAAAAIAAVVYWLSVQG